MSRMRTRRTGNSRTSSFGEDCRERVNAIAAASRKALLPFVVAIALVSCSDGVFQQPPTTIEIASQSGLVEVAAENASADTPFFLDNLKRDLPDDLGYPAVGGRVTMNVDPNPATSYNPGVTWEAEGGNAAGFDSDGDGSVDGYRVEGTVFVETGEYSSVDSAYAGMPLRLTGAQLTVGVDGSIEGTAELPDFSDVGGFFSGISWSDITPARVMTATGAEIKAYLEEQGSDLTMPITDERVYFLFFLNGDITAVAGGGLSVYLPIVPDMPSAAFAFILDSADPMFYVTYSSDKGFLEGDGEDADDGEDGDGADGSAGPTGTSGEDGRRESSSSSGLMGFPDIPIDGFGLSYNGWILAERANTWPFNEDSYGNPLYDENDLLNVYSGDPRSYDPATELYLPLFPTVYRGTSNADSTRRTFVGDAPDPAEFNSITTIANDPIDRLYYYDPSQFGHVYVQGEIPLQSLGIPASVTDVTVLIDPEGTMGDIDSIGNVDLPFRLMSNGVLDLFPNKQDEDSFFQIPEGFVGFTALVEHTSARNRLLWTISGDTRDYALSDFIDLSQLGELPDTGMGPLSPTGAASVLIGETAPGSFLDGIDMAWLDSLAHPADASFNVAGYMSFPPGPAEIMYMVGAEFELNPFALINSALGTSISGATSRLNGSLMYGYPYGIFLSGFSGYSIPQFQMSTSGDSLLSAWIVSHDNWGFHYDTNLEIVLFGGLGTVTLQDAFIDLNNESFGAGGTFSLDTSLPDTSANVAVRGDLDFVAPDFSLSGAADIRLLGFDLLEATMDIGYTSGVAMAGRLAVPNLSTLEMSGSYSPATNDFALGGTADITLFGDTAAIPDISLANATVYFSNQGVSVAGGLEIPGAGELEVGGEVEVGGDFRFYGSGDIEVAGVPLSGASVEFYNEGSNAGIIMRGELSIPHLLTTQVHGEMDLDAGRLTLSGSGDVGIPGTSETLLTATIQIVADVGLDGSVTGVQLRLNTGFSIGSYLNTTIATADPNHLALTAGASGPTVQGDVCGSCVLAVPKFGFNFDRLGFDIEFSVSGQINIDITLHVDTVDWSNNGFAIAALATLRYSHPWVTSELRESCKSVLGVSVCVWYPYFNWTTRTGSLSVSGGISLSESGVSFYVDLPIVGRQRISF